MNITANNLFNWKDRIHIWHHWDRWVTSSTYVNLDGMNGFTFANTQLSSLTKKRRKIKCASGYSNRMAKCFQGGLSKN